MAARLAAPRRAIGAPSKAFVTTMATQTKLQRRQGHAVAATPTSPSPSPSSRPRYRVAVVGGGVIGLSTALRLAEKGRESRDCELSVAVLARGFGPETTSGGAGGLWEPYKLGDTPPELVNRWAAETLAHLLALARGGGARGGAAAGRGAEATGCLEGPVLQYWTRPAPEDPPWAAVAPGFRRLRARELEAAHRVARRGAEANRRRRSAAAAEAEGGGLPPPSLALEAPAIVDGWTFSSAAAQPSRYLAWLAARAEALGVELVRRELASLDELLAPPPLPPASSPAAAAAAAARPRFDAVVNCAGLAGGDLCRDDTTPPTPVRGQVARLRPGRGGQGGPGPPPALPLGGAAGLFLDEETYLIRNVDFVVAGGTGQARDAGVEPRAADRESILARTRLLSPELLEERADGGGRGREIEDWAGLRPLRSPVRLEARRSVEVGAGGATGEEREGEEKEEEEEKRGVLVVSNYGHGGSGFTLHWGCAGDAAALVLEGLKEDNRKGRIR